jgi:3-hydroxyacyl-[acyl-carrier-protein] dehydratase
MRHIAHLESPHAYPFIMLDRVESYDRKQRKLVGLKCVPRSEPLLQGHFPGFPIFPGVLLIECLSQASAVLLKLDAGWPPLTRTLLADSRIKHMRPVYPGDQIRLECQITLSDANSARFCVRALVDGEEVTRGQLALRHYAGNDPGGESCQTA